MRRRAERTPFRAGLSGRAFGHLKKFSRPNPVSPPGSPASPFPKTEAFNAPSQAAVPANFSISKGHPSVDEEESFTLEIKGDPAISQEEATVKKEMQKRFVPGAIKTNCGQPQVSKKPSSTLGKSPPEVPSLATTAESLGVPSRLTVQSPNLRGAAACSGGKKSPSASAPEEKKRNGKVSGAQLVPRRRGPAPPQRLSRPFVFPPRRLGIGSAGFVFSCRTRRIL